MKSYLINIFFVGLIFTASIYFYLSGITDLVNLSFIKNNMDSLKENIKQNFFSYFIYFFLVYIIASALAFPVVSVLSLLIGATFNFLPAILLISFASTIGAVLSFCIARTILRKFLEKKFKSIFLKVNIGLEKDGSKYLFLLRMTPVIPFFLVNLVFGLTNIKLYKFYFISQLGMLPATILYVNAGKQISNINNIYDVINYKVIISFILIGIFPLTFKKFYHIIVKHKR